MPEMTSSHVYTYSERLTNSIARARESHFWNFGGDEDCPTHTEPSMTSIGAVRFDRISFNALVKVSLDICANRETLVFWKISRNYRHVFKYLLARLRPSGDGSLHFSIKLSSVCTS